MSTSKQCPFDDSVIHLLCHEMHKLIQNFVGYIYIYIYIYIYMCIFINGYYDEDEYDHVERKRLFCHTHTVFFNASF